MYFTVKLFLILIMLSVNSHKFHQIEKIKGVRHRFLLNHVLFSLCPLRPLWLKLQNHCYSITRQALPGLIYRNDSILHIRKMMLVDEFGFGL